MEPQQEELCQPFSVPQAIIPTMMHSLTRWAQLRRKTIFSWLSAIVLSFDRDTAFPIALNLSVKAKNLGKDVNYLLAWNRPHSGDYALNELFNWLDAVTGNKK